MLLQELCEKMGYFVNFSIRAQNKISLVLCPKVPVLLVPVHQLFRFYNDFLS